MPRILLSFLGTNAYKSCQYLFDDQTSPEVTYFVSVAAKYLQPDQLLSIQTIEATNKHGESLRRELTEHFDISKYQVISIPSGKKETELWEIFEQITEKVPEHCELFLDITHGFRSLPILAYIALSYLRVTRKVRIGGVYYGAYEARNENNIAPTFDLTPFLSLLDWTSAADQFLSTGSAERLGDMLQNAQRSAWKNPHKDSGIPLPRSIIPLGNKLKENSENLLLLRTRNLKGSADALSNLLAAASQEAQQHARPFLEVIDRVEEEFSSFNDYDLNTLREVIRWLAARKQVIPALTLTSEWLTSWVMVALGAAEHHVNEDLRKPYAQCINLLVDQESGTNSIKDPSEESKKHLDELRQKYSEFIPIVFEIASKIRQPRNDTNHAGFRDYPMKSSTLINVTREIDQLLWKLPIPGVDPEAE